jgi:arylsulfatase A-like enzyme
MYRSIAALILVFFALAAEATRPNIVFILIDDLGWRDLGCYGNTFHETPNIDRLAREGLRFTQAYAAGPVCSPTRASILTGKYPARLQLTDFLKGKRTPENAPVLPALYADQLPLEETTLAELLRAAGYVTAHAGKWHLGGAGFAPEQQGFALNLTGNATGGVNSFFWPAWKSAMPLAGRFEGDYLTDRLTDEACAFVRQHKDQPFFLYLCHFAVHIPLEAKPEKIEKYQAKRAAQPAPDSGHQNPYYAAMLESLDEGIGSLMDTLRDTGVADNTLVIFFSDNGGLSVLEGRHTPATTNAPLRAGKGYLYEGGLRVPCIVRWPRVVPAGAVCDARIISNDFFATLRDAAGLETLPGANPPDSVSFRDLLAHPDRQPREERPLFWHYPHYSNQGGDPGAALRLGPWKLIEWYGDGRCELYNLEEDSGETRDLAAVLPEKCAELRALLAAWREETHANMPRPNPDFRPAG